MTGGLVSLPSVMDLYDVKEMFSKYYVDPDIAKQNENKGTVLLTIINTKRKRNWGLH